MQRKTSHLAYEMRQNKSYIRFLAHINICVQVALLLALSFTPVMVARAEIEDKKFLMASVPWKIIPYVLQPGDTLAQMAEKHHLTVAQLKTLNQYRTFAHSF